MLQPEARLLKINDKNNGIDCKNTHTNTVTMPKLFFVYCLIYFFKFNYTKYAL